MTAAGTGDECPGSAASKAGKSPRCAGVIGELEVSRSPFPYYGGALHPALQNGLEANRLAH